MNQLNATKSQVRALKGGKILTIGKSDVFGQYDFFNVHAEQNKNLLAKYNGSSLALWAGCKQMLCQTDRSKARHYANKIKAGRY
jgi:hypothetical protein